MSAPGAPIPYRSLVKTALLTLPLLAFGFAGPIFILSGGGVNRLAFIAMGASMVGTIAWSANLAVLSTFRKLKWWAWLQVPVIGGVMVLVSTLVINAFHDSLPPVAQQYASIRYVNAFALNAIIYVIIDMRLLSDTKAQLVAENAQLRLSNLETQYQILKDQVNPHFLFNALATARSLVRRDPALTEAYIVRLSEFLRATLQDMRDSVPLADELRLVRGYIELQQMRFQEALVFECPPDTEVAGFTLPYFALLTLVENAVKHNAMSADAPLRIRISRTGDRISVWNNRQHKALHSASSGSGLSNLRKRCEVLGNGDIEILDSADSYMVTLNLLAAK
ncbi:MAG: sensor histidine kinase [Bacteroidia bacterium]